MWTIASVPFWVLGGCMVGGGWVAAFQYMNRGAYESGNDLVRQFALGNAVGGLLLIFAAWVAS